MSNVLEPKLKQFASKALWLKCLYIILFLAIGYVTIFVTLCVVIFQFFSNLLFRKSNEHLLTFGRSLSLYMAEVICYITYNDNQLPFPFKSWPSATPSDSNQHKRGH